MSRRLTIKLVVLFSVLAISVAYLSICLSSEEKEENWGIELPLPEGTTGPVHIFSIYYNQKNEVVIPYYFSNKDKKFTRYYNFSTNTFENECQGDKQERKQCNKNITKDFEKIYFKLDLFTNSGLHFKAINDGNCSHPLSNSIDVEGNNGEIFRRKIIKFYKDKEVFITSPDCSLSSGKEKHFIHLESLLFSFFILKNGEIIGIALEKPIVIKFKEDMTSPYLKNNKNYILMDGKKVDDIYHQCLHEIYKTKTNLSEIEAADACFVKSILK